MPAYLMHEGEAYIREVECGRRFRFWQEQTAAGHDEIVRGLEAHCDRLAAENHALKIVADCARRFDRGHICSTYARARGCKFCRLRDALAAYDRHDTPQWVDVDQVRHG